jgi:hypothetical protein
MRGHHHRHTAAVLVVEPMRAIILVDIDGTYEQGEEVLDQLEEMAAEGAALNVGGGCFVEVVRVQEAPMFDEKGT